MSGSHRNRRGARPPGALRIIGGRWRGRRLSFDAAPGLRPTGDRIRETVFNWLAPTIAGARCLDLFGGSGALAFEALSRGAAHCVLVDNAAAVCRRATDNAKMLDTDDIDVIRADAVDWLTTAAPGPFDVAFVDPPFAADLLTAALGALALPGRLAAGAEVYIEYPAGRIPAAPATWQLRRERRAGDVGYALFSVGGS